MPLRLASRQTTNHARKTNMTIDISKHKKLPINYAENSNSNSNSIHNIHNIHTYIQSLVDSRGVMHAVYCSPELWEVYKQVIQPSSISEDLRMHMAQRIQEAIEQKRDPQLHLTQYFTQVNVQNVVKVESKPKLPEKPKVDYSKLSLEELQQRYEIATAGQRQVIAYELKRRGLP